MSFKVGAFSTGENRVDAEAGKGGAMAAKATGVVQNARRAFGDIGNTVGGLPARIEGKENGAAAGAAAACGPAHDAAAGASAILANAANAASWGTTRPRTSILRPVGAPPVAAPGVLTRAQARSLGLEGPPPAARASFTAELGRRGEPAAPAPLPDIDAADKENPLAVTAYVNEIYAFFKRAEPELKPSAAYMAGQADINDKMRAILVDWLVEVHLKFKLMPETLYLTVNLIDRFLAKKPVTRKNLQLVGVTAMLIASKYEEIWAPEVRDFVYISDKAYTRDQILGMEKLMLNTLGFKLTLPTPHVFLTRFLKAAGADKRAEHLAHYLVELTLPEYGLLKYAGSLTAAAAVYCAQRTLGAPAWTPVLARHADLSEADVRPAAAALAALHRKAASASLVAVHKKYGAAKYGEIARTAADGPLADEGDVAAAIAAAQARV